ncbi:MULTISPECIES: hypothetical protein [Paraburkholderia]|uniref:Uncharacterized protein n=1 Tax=Paraburkholderia tropica TaxID=92647 RepID=A0AAQ1GGL7_9BURK|nr:MULTISPECIES: hypothetical protein [Paraburkholderia]QNB12089.1 hypothetical protein G5S35_11270 [Paraburkholderia tropica]RQM49771.1 hypothetical protein EHZ19_05090 [Paraburkholderia bannensis]RQN41105.1 hypothetical protein EHZ25_02400 [Paraburkholderia tropica]SEJ79959.1 hypothetical protein SAMN05216550_108339 [Paraburkholderia tropica]
MTDTKAEITKRLAVLVGLEVSWVSHAGDMLTMQFGPQRRHTLRGREREDGAWALHVQCDWRIERDGRAASSREDLRGADEKAHDTATRLHGMLVGQGPIKVEKLSAYDTGGMVIVLSRGYRLEVVPDGIEDDEDWRFFAPGIDAAHLVIEGGKVAAESFD